MTTVDFHAHVLEPDVLRRCGNNSVLHGFGAKPVPPPDPSAPIAGAFARMLDPDLQLADMDARGIEMSVISTSTIIQNTGWAEPALQAELEGQANDEIARWVGRSPDRFIGSFTLPLRDLGLALAELARCTGDLDLRVANLPAAVDGVYLGAPDFRPLWEALLDLGVVAFIHPDGVRDPWFQEYSLWNSVGQPIDEAKVMASLILEGVLEDLPELRIVMAHGGGYLPHYFGRLDRNVTNMPDSVRNISGKPSDYLRAFHFDTCVYDVSILDALVGRVGAHRLVLGSDYPVGDPDPVGFVRRSQSITERDVELICGSTASSLLSR